MTNLFFEEKGNNIIQDKNLMQEVLNSLIENKIGISAAESCTGGGFSKAVTEISGASAVFDRGIVTYSNRAKIAELGVSSETIAEFGAVSKQTAREMAEGIKIVSGSELGVSITGIAGPGGATKEKPVGLIYMAVSNGDITKVREVRLLGNRHENRENSILNMFDLLKEFLFENMLDK